MSQLLQLLVSGLLTGLVYALISVGLTLIFGVMDIVNFAHGEFLMLAMYAALGSWLYLHVQPVLALPICVALLFLFGVSVYRVVIRRLLKGPAVAQIFGTFGLLVFLQGAAQLLFGADYRGVSNPLISGSVHIGALNIGRPELATGIGALIVTALIYLFLEYTETGRALRAVAEDRVAAALVGINVERVNALAFGIGAACVGAAGALLANHYQVFPRVGAEFALTAFVVVALGGFGSIEGAFVAALLVGAVEVIGGFYISPALKMVPVYVLYLAVVLLRPQGILGRR